MSTQETPETKCLISQGGLLQNKPLQRAEGGLEADFACHSIRPATDRPGVSASPGLILSQIPMLFPGVSFGSVPGYLCHAQPQLCTHLQA